MDDYIISHTYIDHIGLIKKFKRKKIIFKRLEYFI